MLWLWLLTPFAALELIMLFPPSRDREWTKVMYMGLPGWIAEGEDHPVVAGPATLPMHIAYNGWMMLYRGSYVVGLWSWITRKDWSE